MPLEAGSKLTPAKICQMITDLHCNIILSRVTEKNKPLHICYRKKAYHAYMPYLQTAR